MLVEAARAPSELAGPAEIRQWRLLPMILYTAKRHIEGSGESRYKEEYEVLLWDTDTDTSSSSSVYSTDEDAPHSTPLASVGPMTSAELEVQKEAAREVERQRRRKTRDRQLRRERRRAQQGWGHEQGVEMGHEPAEREWDRDEWQATQRRGLQALEDMIELLL